MIKEGLRYAGFSQRLLAHNVDLLPILFLLYGYIFFFPKIGFDWLIFFIIYLAYNIGFELSRWQATPGKRWAKIHVQVDDGRQQPYRIILRNFLKIFSLLIFFLGFVLIIFNSRRKGLHDYLAGTVVLFDEH
ncbi:MAG: RDD family protein [Cyclobacteriaceae bacterium]